MANGGHVCGEKRIKIFTWSMQGKTFKADVILFPLVGCDVILGMHSLRTLGPVTWDCANLTMEFTLKDRKIKLEAFDQANNQLYGAKQ